MLNLLFGSLVLSNGGFEGLLDVSDKVINVLDSNGESNQVVGDAQLQPIFGRDTLFDTKMR